MIESSMLWDKHVFEVCKMDIYGKNGVNEPLLKMDGWSSLVLSDPHPMDHGVKPWLPPLA